MFVCSIGITKSKMYFQKKRKFRRVGGVDDYGILRAWGGNAFWNFRSQGGGLWNSEGMGGVTHSGISRN